MFDLTPFEIILWGMVLFGLVWAFGSQIIAVLFFIGRDVPSDDDFLDCWFAVYMALPVALIVGVAILHRNLNNYFLSLLGLEGKKDIDLL